MAKLLKFLASKGIVIQNPIGNDSSYRIPQKGDARNDFLNISSDMKKVGQDLRSSLNRELNKYGQ